MRTGIGLEVLGHGVSFSYRAEGAALPVFAAPLSLLMLEICKPAFATENIFIRVEGKWTYSKFEGQP
ncbi:hypothetical protein ACFQPC_08295 [Herminiimonas glaciei]|uniref:Uncharacterized protein n=1 Tax=Herminiimonas glaciei TaxID=523788 RepID=A0ABW2IAM6_9BURK